LRTSTPSVKEIAYELGYSRQHDLAGAYHKYGSASQSELKMHAKAAGRTILIILTFSWHHSVLSHSSTSSANNSDIPKMRNAFPDLLKTPAWVEAKQEADCVLFQAK
jgi:hypothetical protein